jgi:hypothetical protein
MANMVETASIAHVLHEAEILLLLKPEEAPTSKSLQSPSRVDIASVLWLVNALPPSLFVDRQRRKGIWGGFVERI